MAHQHKLGFLVPFEVKNQLQLSVSYMALKLHVTFDCHICQTFQHNQCWDHTEEI